MSGIPERRSSGDRALARRERDLARTRDDILSAAAVAFARQGFDATTMHAIAKEAGYTAPSLYSYFRSKEEIVVGLFERMRGEIRAIFDAPVPAGLSFRQRLDFVVRRQLELLDERRDSVACFISLRPPCAPAEGDGARGGTKSNRSARTGVVPLNGLDLHAKRLAEWFEAHASPHDLGGYAVDDAACALIGIQHAFFRRWLGGARATPLEDSSDLILTLFLHGVAPSPTPPEGKKKR